MKQRDNISSHEPVLLVLAQFHGKVEQFITTKAHHTDDMS